VDLIEQNTAVNQMSAPASVVGRAKKLKTRICGLVPRESPNDPALRVGPRTHHIWLNA